MNKNYFTFILNYYDLFFYFFMKLKILISSLISCFLYVLKMRVFYTSAYKLGRVKIPPLPRLVQ